MKSNCSPLTRSLLTSYFASHVVFRSVSDALSPAWRWDGPAAHILTRTLPAIIHFPLPRHHFFWKRNSTQLYLGADKSSFLVEWYAIKLVRDVLMKFFLSHFHKCFWPIKGVYFLQNANNLNFKLFLGCIYIYSIHM